MRKITLIAFLGLFCCAIQAQMSTGELPYSWGKSIDSTSIRSIPKKILDNLDMESITMEDLENEVFATPFRFGFPQDVNFTLSNSGIWKTTSDGGRLWNLRVYSPDALSLNLLYDKFWLPEGAKFFIYSEDMQQHIGAFTSENNKGDKKDIQGFATGFLFTKNIVLEYYEPKGVSDNAIISISQIISGYRHIYNITGDENQNRGNDPNLLPCHNDVNCSAGNNYKNEKNAIALMVMGERSCSGALLNTTVGDNRPVFLSADHCFVSYPNSSQWIFYWNYEAPCGGRAVKFYKKYYLCKKK